MPTTKSISQMPTKAIPHAGDLFEVAVEDQNSATGYASGKMSAEVIANGMLNTYNYPVAMPNMQTKTIIGALNALLGNFAPVYDATSTYNENDLVTYEGVLYKANQDITVAEAWNSAHWTQTTASESGGGGGGDASKLELTQLEYDALSEAQKNNGLMYFITDANGDESQFQPIICSETEREIGVWVDGRPLYEKTWTLNNLTLTRSGWTDTDIILGSQQGDYVLIESTVRDSNYAILTAQVTPWSSNGKVAIYNFRTADMIAVSITMRYIKIDDVAGSGTWTPQGVPTVHYDGNEKVIGTWFGETLYEKTVNVGQLPNNDNKSVSHGISNLGCIVEIQGYANGYPSAGAEEHFFPMPLASPTSPIVLYAKETTIQIQTTSDRSNLSGYVTIRYTKATS